jgi:hypothetical protein
MPTDATSVKPSRAPVEPSIFGGRSRPRRRRTATGDQRLPTAAALMVFASGSLTEQATRPSRQTSGRHARGPCPSRGWNDACRPPTRIAACRVGRFVDATAEGQMSAHRRRGGLDGEMPRGAEHTPARPAVRGSVGVTDNTRGTSVMSGRTRYSAPVRLLRQVAAERSNRVCDGPSAYAV